MKFASLILAAAAAATASATQLKARLDNLTAGEASLDGSDGDILARIETSIIEMDAALVDDDVDTFKDYLKTLPPPLRRRAVKSRVR